MTYTPTQHFSARGLFDRCESLWGGYVIEHAGHKIYFGGDAGYSSHYVDMFKKMGAMDLSLIGIGAYEPRWFMKSIHMNPSEAVQAHKDLHSKKSIAMHFGTFQLAGEGIDQPILDLDTAREKAGITKDQFDHMLEGETRVFTF